MSDIPPIQAAGQMAGFAGQRSSLARQTVQDDDSATDRLEISETGRLLSSLGPDSPVRVDRVAEIRQAIADGTYETPEKLEITVDRLLEALRTTNVTA